MAGSTEASQGRPSKVEYRWVILFMYNAEVEYPFSCEHVKDLEASGFPFYLVDGPLDDESRTVPFQLFSGRKFCLFAKIQNGNLKHIYNHFFEVYKGQKQ